MLLRKTETEFVCRVSGAELLHFGFNPQEIRLCTFDKNQKGMHAMANYMIGAAIKNGILDNLQDEYSVKVDFMPILVGVVCEAVEYDVMITVWGMKTNWHSDSMYSQRVKKKEELCGLMFQDWNEVFGFYRATKGFNYKASLYKFHNRFYLMMEVTDNLPNWVMYEFSIRQLHPTSIAVLKEHGDCIIRDFISELSAV